MIDERYIILIHKRLRRELSEADQYTLQKWLDQSPEHQQLLREMETTWKLSGDYLAGYTPNVDKGLDKLRRRIREEETPVIALKHSRGKSRTSFIPAIAAGLLLLIAAIVVWSFWFSPAEMLVVSTSQGEQKTIPLADGSTIVLNENSSLSYPSFFRGDRLVELQGEAFFEVSRDERHTFTISTSRTNTEVLGTSFNIRAYEDEGYTEVEVVKGIVRLADKEGKNPLELEQGHRGTYDHHTNLLLPDQPKALNASYWKERRLRFKGHLLSEAIKEVKSRLGLDIEVTNPQLLACSLTLAVEIDQPETNIIAVIADNYNASFSRDSDNTYRIEGGDCQLR